MEKSTYQKSKPFVDIIYSFRESGQKFDKKNITQSVLNDRDLFFMFLTHNLFNTEKETLSKISCCIYWAEHLQFPAWYDEDEIPELMLKLYGINCTYEPVNT